MAKSKSSRRRTRPAPRAAAAESALPRFARHEHAGQAPVFPVRPRNPKLHVRRNARYGWAPDLPDERDHQYAAPMAISLPPRYDLRDHYGLPPVYDQGQLGSCTGNSIAAAIQFERMRQNLPSAGLVPSRLFIYYNERAMEGTINSDSGAQIRDGIKSAGSQGDCFEGTAADQWPYVISRFRRKPPPACYAEALKDRAVSYSRLTPTVAQLKGCLASGYPFVFGFTVYSSFEGPDVAKSGVVQMPAPGETVVGGHAVLAVGYDDGAQRFTVRNSWGATWGQKGYFTIPYAYLISGNLADDFWTIRLVSPA